MGCRKLRRGFRRRLGNALGSRSRNRGVGRAGIAERSGSERPGLRLSR
jgi:hypothetical protein